MMFLIILLILIIILIYFFKNKEKISNNTLIVRNFNTEWCGYSKKFQPTWDNLVNSNTNNNVQFQDIKCDDPKNNNICYDNNKYKINGFPQILFEDNNGNISTLNKPRTLENILNTITYLLK